LIIHTENDKPDIKYLNSHVRPQVCGACHNPEVWRDLGIELLGQEADASLNTISTNSRNVIQCCSSMFSLWLERQPEASWKQLVEALMNVNLNALGVKIKNLLTPKQQADSQKISSDLQGTLLKFSDYVCAHACECVCVYVCVCVRTLNRECSAGKSFPYCV